MKTTKQQRLIKKKIKLYLNQECKCYYCGKFMVLTLGLDVTKLLGNKTPNNVATIEHIYSRFEKERYDNTRDHGLNVLACRSCNHAVGVKKERIYKNAN